MSGSAKFASLIAAFLAGAIAIPLILLMIASFGWLSVDGVSAPPPWEKQIAQTSLEASLARRSKGLKNPISGNDAELLVGMKSYKMACAGCHGDYSGPSTWGSNDFYPRVPQFAQHPPTLSAPEMFVAIRYGIRYSGMGGVDGLMPDRKIWSIAMFLRRLSSLPPSVDRIWKAKPRSLKA
jgi:hypothetical protein